MKTSASAFLLAAFVALVLTQFALLTAVAVLCTAGVLALAVADYGREIRPLALPATAKWRPRRREPLGLAA